ncbi:Zn(2)-C6 fungal-type domain-containing protein [Fusarium sp. Ph1]|nr:Zn(2)-C6 fungal-type domain-containing protein [Fusarium sp. Ph1]
MDKLPSGPPKTRCSSNTRIYSKSGCRTCKIRRLKCDKGRPGCRRCLSTGRVCDGYGVWGEGPAVTPGNLQQRTLHDLSTRSRVGPRNGLERESFDWFRHRASVKLCGVFSSRFWDTLVLQASVTAPAVLHALLALGSAHRLEVMRSCPQEEINSESCEQQERFTLEQYNKAIACLRPHFAKTDRDASSTRMVLITCAIFVCLELLQGRYMEGQTHLENGLNLLSQLQADLQPAGTQGLIVLGHPQESINDSYLTEAFSRLYAQSSLFGRVPGGCCKSKSYAIATILADSTIQAPPPLFGSMSQARQHLDGLFNAIHCLTVQCPRERIVREAPIEILDTQSRILTGLRLWQRAYKVSRLNLTSQLNVRDALSYPLLTVYHTMAVVMTTTCLAPPDESIFDSFEESFVSVVSTCEHLLEDAITTIVADKAEGYCSGGFSFTADIGLIPPLYYTALKCRVPSLRCRAITMLETATHKETIWNGAVAARIAREVVTIEEEGASVNVDRDHIPPDTQMAVLGSYRVRQVSIDLSDRLAEKAILTCERRRSDGGWELMRKVMHLS